MYYRVGLGSRLSRMTTTAIIQMPYPYARMFTTVGSHATPDQTKTPPPKKSRGNTTLYIGGGLAAVGAIWYYYTMVENVRIERESETTSSPAKVSLGISHPRAAGDMSRSVKERTEEALKSGNTKYQEVKAEAQSKAQEVRGQASQSLEHGKQRYEDSKNEVVNLASEARSATGK
jgi:ElaB/YqjD/DUF883 family membrane-anchored ribosome-binding protein